MVKQASAEVTNITYAYTRTKSPKTIYDINSILSKLNRDTLSNTDYANLNRLLGILSSELDLTRNRSDSYRARSYYTSHKSVYSDKYIEQFLTSHLVFDEITNQLMFRGEAYYEPVIWSLDTEDQCKRVARFIIDRHTVR